ATRDWVRSVRTARACRRLPARPPRRSRTRPSASSGEESRPGGGGRPHEAASRNAARTMSTTPRRVALLAPLSGVLVPLERVPDPVFAQRTVGDGVSIDPTSSELLAPAGGLVTLLHRGAHALAITTDEGIEVLLHIGIDTVTLKGRGFTPRVSQGDRVAAGQR